MKYFLIHGSFGNPNENWFPWLKEYLEQKGNEVFIPTFPTPQNQSLESWTEVFHFYKKHIDENTIFIGHSLGPAFILSILENLDFEIKKCIFVSGFLGLIGNPEFDKINKTFTTKEFDWNKIKANCSEFIMFNSDNDPYVSLENSLKLAKNLEIEIKIIKNGEHINESAGFNKFEKILEFLE